MYNNKIFQCKTDLQWVRKKIDQVKRVRGYRTQMAKAAGCQPAYLSQVLSEQAQFTLEQAEGLCQFWEMDDLQSEYFLNLVQLRRAGTVAFKKRIRKRLHAIREDYHRKALKEVEVDNRNMDHEDVLQYYRNWLPTALHMLWLVPKFKNNIKASAQRLKVSETEVSQALELLTNIGFLERNAKGFQVSSKHANIPNESHYSRLHHNNWRLRSMESNQNVSSYNFHFTSLYSLDEKTIEKIGPMLEKLIVDCKKTVDPAPESTVACLNIDFFEI